MAAVGIVLFLLVGCSRPDPPAAEQTVRLVSLSPAISRCLVDLGLADRVVGRSTFCTALPPSIPVAGDLQTVDFERLVRLAPTHVLVQPPASGVDPGLVEMAEQEGWTLGQWHLNDLDDVQDMVGALPAIIDAADAGLADRAATLVAALADCRSPAAGCWSGRTLLVAGTEPVLVFGHGTYLHDMLVALGAVNATTATEWATLSLEDVVRLDPQAIVIVTPSGDDDGDPVHQAGPLASLDVAATRDGRIAVLGHRDVFLPSTGLVEVADELRRTLDGFAGPGS